MGQILPTFPDQPQVTMTVTLDSTQYQIRFTWRSRLRAWYWDLYTLGGTALASGRRLSPGWDQLFGLYPESGRPPGYLFCRGIDPYNQDMLGNLVLPVYYTLSEVPAPSTDTGLRITAAP